MKKLLTFIICAILPAIAFAQYMSKDFTLDDTDVTTSVALRVPVSNADSVIVLHNTSRASGLFVSGCANLANDDDSYVRITLKDTDSNEYLIYELYPILAESRQCPFSKIGLESAYLDNIHPQSIRIETLNASVTLDSVYFVVPERSSRNMSKAIPNRKAQCEHIANKLNERLISGNKTWRAGVTFVSQMTFEEKKWLMGKNTPVLYGFDYYKGGVFVMPGFSRYASLNTNTRSSDDYVTEWDWRNRHGKNWVTSVKDQESCKACWAFSSVGTFESYINLYYNKLLNLDLSEQELILADDYIGDCHEGYIDLALNFLCNSGTVFEECLRYKASDTIPKIYTCFYPDRLSIGGYSADYSDSFPADSSYLFKTEEDSIKRVLFKTPITFGIKNPWRHFMILVGYKVIQSGDNYFNLDSIPISQNDPLVNHPAWLFKNSYGTDWGNNGFGYIAMSLHDAYGIYKLTGNVTSEQQLLTDDDIVCEDADGDGYFNWGIKDSTFTLPIWASQREDGDDSDCTKGPIDMHGNLEDINLSDTMFIEGNTDFDNPQHILRHIKVLEPWDLTITNHVFCCQGVSITLEKGATLYIEGGGILENAILKPQSGSHIVIDGGCIKHNKDVNFKIPIGVTFDQTRGKIE